MSTFAAPARAAAALERANSASPETITYRGRTAVYTPEEQRVVLRMVEDDCPVRQLELLHALKSAFEARLLDGEPGDA